MSQQIINTGASPNDGQGDPIRTAFIKTNSNFATLFALPNPTPPATLIGSAGDVPGMYAYNSSYFYYCFGTWNGTSTIWAQVSQINSVSVNKINNGNSNVNINGANANVTVTVNSVANIATFSTIGLSVAGNVTGNYFIGDGSQLINLPAGNYSNANVANFIPTYSGNIGSLTAIGNIKTISFFVGDGSQLTNLPVVNTDWANIGNIINVNGPTNIAIGQYAGNTQGNFSIAIGQNAGNNIQGGAAVAVGYESGSINQGIAAVAIGSHAGNSIQGNNAVSIGQYSGAENQGSQAVAIGTNAGQLYQGANSIAIGTNAGQGFINAQANNTIILNATGLELDGGNAQTDSFYVAPIRNDTIDTSTPLYYNASTKEITYNSISAEVPTSSTSTGSVGQIASDATYLYVCVAQNNWVRSAIVGGW